MIALLVVAALAPLLQEPSAPAPPEPPPPYGHEEGPFEVGVLYPLVLHDAGRDKDLELTVRYPCEGGREPAGPFPLILFSHGAGGSREAFGEATRHWASRGYVVVLPTHSDSLELRRRAGERIGPDTLEGLRRDVDLLDRLADVRFVLDSIEALEAAAWPAGEAGDEPRPRVDRERIGVAGHSAGALTAQLAAGVWVRGMRVGSRELVGLGDGRIDVVVLVSGQGLTTRLFTEASWSELTKPMLVITGSLDVARVGRETPQSRRQPFELAHPGDKYLVFIEGATHSSYQGRQKPGRLALLGEEQAADPEQVAALTTAATSAFWDAHLGASEPAREQAREALAGDELQRWSGGRATLERK